MKSSDYFPQAGSIQPVKPTNGVAINQTDPAEIVGEISPRGERARALLVISLLVEIRDLLKPKQQQVKTPVKKTTDA
jgi:hypothetical protein